MTALSRNVNDLNFIKKHINKIYVINDKRIYNPQIDWKELINSNVSSMEEIEKIKFRIKHNLNKRHKPEEERKTCAKIRCTSIYSLLKDKYDEELLNDIIKFINMSQEIYYWDEINKLYSSYTHKSLINIYNGNNCDETYHITRNDLLLLVKNMFQSYGYTILNEDPLIKEFINSYLNFRRKFKNSDSDFNSESDFDKNIRDLTSNLRTLLSDTKLNKSHKKEIDKYIFTLLNKKNKKK